MVRHILLLLVLFGIFDGVLSRTSHNNNHHKKAKAAVAAVLHHEELDLMTQQRLKSLQATLKTGTKQQVEISALQFLTSQQEHQRVANTPNHTKHSAQEKEEEERFIPSKYMTNLLLELAEICGVPMGDECQRNSQCDDQNVCTDDICKFGKCTNDPIPDCGDCATDLDCNDGNMCSDDWCDMDTRKCERVPIPYCDCNRVEKFKCDAIQSCVARCSDCSPTSNLNMLTNECYEPSPSTCKAARLFYCPCTHKCSRECTDCDGYPRKHEGTCAAESQPGSACSARDMVWCPWTNRCEDTCAICAYHPEEGNDGVCEEEFVSPSKPTQSKCGTFVCPQTSTDVTSCCDCPAGPSGDRFIAPDDGSCICVATPAETQPIRIGCYRDWPGKPEFSSRYDVSPAACVSTCAAAGFKFAGLSDTSKVCGCTNSFGFYSRGAVAESYCDTDCGTGSNRKHHHKAAKHHKQNDDLLCGDNSAYNAVLKVPEAHIFDWIMQENEFTFMARALKKAQEYWPDFKPCEFTFLIPNDKAFNQWPCGTFDQLLEVKPYLEAFLKIHMIQGKYSMDDLASSGSAATFLNYPKQQYLKFKEWSGVDSILAPMFYEEMHPDYRWNIGGWTSTVDQHKYDAVYHVIDTPLMGLLCDWFDDGPIDNEDVNDEELTQPRDTRDPDDTTEYVTDTKQKEIMCRKIQFCELGGCKNNEVCDVATDINKWINVDGDDKNCINPDRCIRTCQYYPKRIWDSTEADSSPWGATSVGKEFTVTMVINLEEPGNIFWFAQELYGSRSGAPNVHHPELFATALNWDDTDGLFLEVTQWSTGTRTLVHELFSVSPPTDVWFTLSVTRDAYNIWRLYFDGQPAGTAIDMNALQHDAYHNPTMTEWFLGGPVRFQVGAEVTTLMNAGTQSWVPVHPTVEMKMDRAWVYNYVQSPTQMVNMNRHVCDRNDALMTLSFENANGLSTHIWTPDLAAPTDECMYQKQDQLEWQYICGDATRCGEGSMQTESSSPMSTFYKCTLVDDKVYLMSGGKNFGSGAQSDVRMDSFGSNAFSTFDLQTHKWEDKPNSMPTTSEMGNETPVADWEIQQVLTQNGYVFVMDDWLRIARFNTKTEEWKVLCEGECAWSSRRQQYAAAINSRGDIYVHGGIKSQNGLNPPSLTTQVLAFEGDTEAALAGSKKRRIRKDQFGAYWRLVCRSSTYNYDYHGTMEGECPIAPIDLRWKNQVLNTRINDPDDEMAYAPGYYSAEAMVDSAKRFGHQAVFLSDDRFMIYGGCGRKTMLNNDHECLENSDWVYVTMLQLPNPCGIPIPSSHATIASGNTLAVSIPFDLQCIDVVGRVTINEDTLGSNQIPQFSIGGHEICEPTSRGFWPSYSSVKCQNHLEPGSYSFTNINDGTHTHIESSVQLWGNIDNDVRTCVCITYTWDNAEDCANLKKNTAIDKERHRVDGDDYLYFTDLAGNVCPKVQGEGSCTRQNKGGSDTYTKTVCKEHIGDGGQGDGRWIPFPTLITDFGLDLYYDSVNVLPTATIRHTVNNILWDGRRVWLPMFYMQGETLAFWHFDTARGVWDASRGIQGQQQQYAAPKQRDGGCMVMYNNSVVVVGGVQSTNGGHATSTLLRDVWRFSTMAQTAKRDLSVPGAMYPGTDTPWENVLTET